MNRAMYIGLDDEADMLAWKDYLKPMECWLIRHCIVHKQTNTIMCSTKEAATRRAKRISTEELVQFDERLAGWGPDI